MSPLVTNPCTMIGCGKPPEDNIHAVDGKCFARPEICKRIHRHHRHMPAKKKATE